MKISLSSIGKKYNKKWLFKQLDYDILPNQTIAITGHNGSGKSTLLQLILGYQIPSVGKITYTLGDKIIADEDTHKHISFAAPYIELPEELTLLEAIAFHFSFKIQQQNSSINQMINDAGLFGNEDKQVKYFSSGMKQRLKLLLAFNTQTEVLLLDEPTSNMDESGIAWYQKVLLSQHHHKTIIIASNQPFEYALADAIIDIKLFTV